MLVELKSRPTFGIVSSACNHQNHSKRNYFAKIVADDNIQANEPIRILNLVAEQPKQAAQKAPAQKAPAGAISCKVGETAKISIKSDVKASADNVLWFKAGHLKGHQLKEWLSET